MDSDLQSTTRRSSYSIQGVRGSSHSKFSTHYPCSFFTAIGEDVFQHQSPDTPKKYPAAPPRAASKAPFRFPTTRTVLNARPDAALGNPLRPLIRWPQESGLGIDECKTRSAGLTGEEIDKLPRLAQTLEASWTFTATLDTSSQCGPEWQINRTSGGIPHFPLSAEHLFDLAPINTVGTTPLGWRTTYLATGGAQPLTDEEHHDQVVQLLRRYEDWSRNRGVPWWRAERWKFSGGGDCPDLSQPAQDGR